MLLSACITIFSHETLSNATTFQIYFIKQHAGFRRHFVIYIFLAGMIFISYFC